MMCQSTTITRVASSSGSFIRIYVFDKCLDRSPGELVDNKRRIATENGKRFEDFNGKTKLIKRRKHMQNRDFKFLAGFDVCHIHNLK